MVWRLGGDFLTGNKNQGFNSTCHSSKPPKGSLIQGVARTWLVAPRRFLLNLHGHRRPLYFSRHGQSEYNRLGKIGGKRSKSAMTDKTLLQFGSVC